MAEVVIVGGNYFAGESTRNNQSIFDVNDTSHCRSFGTYQIAGYLRANGITCQVIEYSQLMDELELQRFVRKFLPKDKSKRSILGISTTFFTYVEGQFPVVILALIKKIKEEYPNVKVVAGGASTASIQQVPNMLDYSIHSYAEDSTLELFSALLGKTPMPLKFKMTTIIDQENSVFDITTSSHRFVKEDCIRQGETLPLEISRGCIFKCAFCRYRYTGKKKNDYIRQNEFVKAELLYNYENFGTTNYYILDDTFNETPDKVESFYKMTQELPFKIQYFAYIRADLVHRFPETATWLMESGLTGAIFGIETFGPKSSNLVAKAWSGKHGKEFLQKLKQEIWKDRVSINVNMIIGLPPDNLKDYMEWTTWAADVGIDNLSWHVFSFSPHGDRLSEIEKYPEKYGFILHKNGDWHNGIYDRNEAFRMYDTIRRNPRKPKQIAAYSLMECLAFYPKEKMMTLPYPSYKNDLIIKRKRYYKQYIDMLKALPESD